MPEKDEKGRFIKTAKKADGKAAVSTSGKPLQFNGKPLKIA
jgi:hypothetical protein